MKSENPAEPKGGRQAAAAVPETLVVARRHRPGQPVIPRRRILQIGFWSGLGAIVAGTATPGAPDNPQRAVGI